MPHAQQTIPLPFRCQPLFCRAKFRCRRTRPDRNKILIYINFLVMRGAFRGLRKVFPCRQGKDRRTSVRQIEKFAPAVWADLSRHDLARPRRTKQAAGGAGEAAPWSVLMLGFSCDIFCCARVGGMWRTTETPDTTTHSRLRRNRVGEAFDNRCAGKLASPDQSSPGSRSAARCRKQFHRV